MKSELEELCRERFDEYIKTHIPNSKTEWEEVDLINEPPDYYLNFLGKRYAVEVTSTALYVKSEKGVVPEETISRSQFKLVKEIEQAVRQSEVLNGAYVLKFVGRLDGFREVKKEIKSKILHFIENTANEEAIDYIIIVEQANGSYALKKLNNKTNRLSAFCQHQRLAIEIHPTCSELLQHAINVKTAKLRRVPHKKILLIYNSFILGTPQTYSECITGIINKEQFELISLVEEDKAFFLWANTASPFNIG